MGKIMEQAGFPSYVLDPFLFMSSTLTLRSVRTLLCIGGINMSDQRHVMSQGFHIVVATPGRLQDMLEKRKFGLMACKYLCLDEADRMIDMGFEDDVRNIMGFFTVCAVGSFTDL